MSIRCLKHFTRKSWHSVVLINLLRQERQNRKGNARKVYILNAVGKEIHAKHRVRDKGAKINQDPTFILAHRLPEIEALIFSVARDLPSDPIFVLSHEGFVVNIHIDTKELEAEVLKRTGFQMPFSSKVLGKK